MICCKNVVDVASLKKECYSLVINGVIQPVKEITHHNSSKIKSVEEITHYDSRSTKSAKDIVILGILAIHYIISSYNSCFIL